MMTRAPRLLPRTSWITRSFPAPAYLTMPAVGIDISDHSIKHASLGRTRHGVAIRSCGKVDLPTGVVERGEIKDPETLSRLIMRMSDEYGYRYIHLALPEEHAYLIQMEFPKGSREELEHLIEFHLKENVPFGADEAYFDFDVFAEHGDRCHINASIYPNTIAQQYLTLFESAGLTLVSMEIEGQATARALLDQGENEVVMIVDLGRNEASLSISVRGMVNFTANLDTGGDYFTRAIARGLDLSFQEAERLKLESGFRDTRKHAAVYETLLPAVLELKDALRKHLTYWQMHTAASGDQADEVSRVVLVGGSANTEGVAEYLEAELGVPVSIGNVWNHVVDVRQELPPVTADESLEYATALGLALRSLLRGN